MNKDTPRLTPEQLQRKAEFDELFEAIPEETNIDKIRYVCGVLFCEENTVRGWRMRNPHRVPSASKLKILRAAMMRSRLLAGKRKAGKTAAGRA